VALRHRCAARKALATERSRFGRETDQISSDPTTMLTFSHAFVRRHREEVAVLFSSATFLAGTSGLFWLLALRF